MLTFTLPLRDGLDAQITWLQGKQERLRSLLVDRLLPAVWARGYKNRDGDMGYSVLSGCDETRPAQ